MKYIRENPNLGLSLSLFLVGLFFLDTTVPTISGALFGAGAALLGGWVTEINSMRKSDEDKKRRELEAKRFLAPELNRAIHRTIYIHERAVVNFGIASKNYADGDVEFSSFDEKQDFLPHMPSLYPHTSKFEDLSGDAATSLIDFYDSLETLHKIVDDWWAREGQLPVNIFLSIKDAARKSLVHAKLCVEIFDLDALYPPTVSATGVLSSRIQKTLEEAEKVMASHLARNNAA